MRPKTVNSLILIAAVITSLVVVPGPALSQPVRGKYLYTLANFTGPLTDNFSRVTVDRKQSEIYVLYQNNVTVFNDSGMEIYRFGDDFDLGLIVDVAVDEQGDILLLAFKESRGSIVRCNFRGEPKSQVELRNLPGALSAFFPNRVIAQGGNLYLLSTMGLQLVIADRQGTFKKGYDLSSLLELEKEKDRGTIEIFGFDVDGEGNALITIPVLFTAYIISPDGKIDAFGKPGSAPGKFNIAAGIARDSKGNTLVVDKLKSAVMVFDKQFKFLSIFGYRGYKPGNLIAPSDIAVDERDKVYVTQAGKRGVSVFQLNYN